MKKVFAFALVMVLALSLLNACGGKTGGIRNNSGTTSTSGDNNSTESKPTPGKDVPASGTTYKIEDYYNSEGALSDLARELPFASDDGERTITVKKGDILTVGGKQYKFVDETIQMKFYTQPSLDEVVAWWTDYFNDLVNLGQMIVVE